MTNISAMAGTPSTTPIVQGYQSVALVFDAYVPAAFVVVVLALRLWPKSSHSKPSLLGRIFTSFVTPEDVHEYDRQEAEAKEQDKQNGAGPNADASPDGYGSTYVGKADGSRRSKVAASDEAWDSETSPLWGGRSDSQILSLTTDVPKQPAAVHFGLSVISVLHLVAWTAALLITVLSPRLASRLGKEAGFQSGAGLQLAAALQTPAWIYASILSCFFPSPTPPYALLAFYAFQLAGSAVSGYHSILSTSHPPFDPPHSSQLAPPAFSIASLALSLVAVALIMSLPLQVYDRNPQYDRNGYPPPLEDYCTLWEWVSFSWLNPIINVALTRPLEETDVSQLSKLSKSQVLLDKMRTIQREDDQAYAAAKAKAQTASADARAKAEKRAEAKKPNLVRQVFWMNSRDMAFDFVLTIVSYSLAYASPFFLKQILDSLQTSAPATEAFVFTHDFSRGSAEASIPTGIQGTFQLYATPMLGWMKSVPDSIDPARKRAFLFAVFALLASLVKTQTDLQHLYYSRRASVRIKTELTLAIYDKALRRKDISGSLQNATSTANAEQAPESADMDAKTDKKDGDAEAAKKAKQQQQEEEDKSAASVGKVVNLMATDANSISTTVTALYMGYSAPLELAIATTFLYKLLGWSAFTGVGPALILMPLQQRFTMMSYENNKGLLKARDKRITVLNELVTSIRFIKFFAWEQGWSKRILSARKEEVKWLYRNAWIMAGLIASFALVPLAFTITAFASYTLIEGKQLDVATGFTAIALFGMLKNPLSVLPMIINMIFQAKVSVDRINTFLQEDEVPSWVVDNALAHDGQGQPNETAHSDRTIVLRDATLRWHAAKPSKKQDQPAAKRSLLSRLQFWKKAKDPKTATATENEQTETEVKPFHLTTLDLRPPPGKMTLICGPTGSGKSSLLSAIMGEMELLEGSVLLPKRPLRLLSGGVAYCSQTAWLETMSIRDNIVFGQYFDQARYDAVLSCCCLEPDLKTFPEGDLTEVGENGVSLSGGQKARVALARAVYSRSPILLLDDVLAAVDSHTAKRLVDECLCGELVKGRTVVLVTHHVDAVLSHVEHVVMLDGGRIKASGSPSELREAGLLSPAVLGLSSPESPNVKGKQAAKDQMKEEEAKDSAVDAQAKAQADDGGKKDPGKSGAASAPGRGKLVSAEGKSTGRVKREIYVTYLSAFGWLFVTFVLLTTLVSRFADVLEKYWLSFWGNAYEHRGGSDKQAWFADPRTNVAPYLGVYVGILMLGYATMILSSLVGGIGAIGAGNKLFSRMLKTVVRSPTRFFDQTPTGRILNRFTKDVETVDTTLFGNIRFLLLFSASCVFSIGTMAVTVPTFVPFLFLITYAYYRTSVSYISAARDLRRLESVTRSPIFQSFSEVLNGIATVRAYGAQERFMQTLFRRLDATQSCYNLFWMANRWLMLRFDVMGAFTVFGASALSLAGGIDAGLAGIAITQAQTLVLALYWLCRCWTGFEMDLNSVERMHEYLALPQEPAAVVEDHRPPPGWPSKIDSRGIQVSKLVLKYAPDLDPVLRGVDFSIGAGEKVGLVGRTGSGKSTLALAFFRFVEYEAGSIVIDGIDISKIGLDDLRSRLTIIPQDPVLFSGTIRENLDPFGERTDEECLLALRRVNLRTSPINTAAPSLLPSRAGSIHEVPMEAHASSSSSTAVNSVLPSGGGSTVFSLDTKVSEGGSNFSQGQRQLISMARALLRSTSIIFMDEATASVDFETDTQIQRTLRSPLDADARHKTTIITIAHRLKTIIDYDRILVMDKGRIAENDSPAALLERKGIFYDMCRKTGEYEELEMLANHAARP